MADATEFRNLVLSYLNVCDKVAGFAKVRKEKTEIEKQILDYMKANNIGVCNLRDGGKLVVKESKAVAPIKKEYLCEQLAAHLGSKEKAEQVTARMWQNRGVTTKAALKRLNSGEQQRDDDGADGA